MRKLLIALLLPVILVSTFYAQPKKLSPPTVIRKPTPPPAKLEKWPVVAERCIVNYEIDADGTFTRTAEILQRLNVEVPDKRFRAFEFPYNAALNDLEVLEAYTLKADGSRITVPATSIQKNLAPEATAAPAYSSLKVLVIEFPDFNVGDAIFVKVKMTQHKALFAGHFDTVEDFPSMIQWDSIEINLNAPKDYKLYAEAISLEGGKVSEENGRSRWSWKGKLNEPVMPEVGAVDVRDISPRVAVSSLVDYKALGAVYWADAKPKATVTTEAKQLADEITKGLETERERARAIYEWVNKNIRYLNISLGRSVYVPDDVSSILKNRYGDCKDYVTVLQALLAAKGIVSTPALARAKPSYWFPSVPAFEHFDHVILYIPGLKMFADATAPNTPFGVLPQPLMGKNAVLAGEETGAIFIPSGTPQENQIKSDVKMTVQEDGKIKAVVSNTYKGRMEILFRPLFADITPEVSSLIMTNIFQVFEIKGTGRITNINNAHKLGEPFGLDLEATLENAINLPGPGIFVVPTKVNLNDPTELAKLINLENRKTPLVAGAHSFVEKFQITFPQNINLKLPTEVKFENAAGSFSSSYKAEGNTISIARELIIKQDIYKPEEYPAFRELIMKHLESVEEMIEYSPASGYKSNKTAENAKIKTGKKNKGVSTSYNIEAIQEIKTPKQAAALEGKLQKTPEDAETRLLLLSYYQGNEKPAIRQAFMRHAKWFIENHPETDWYSYLFDFISEGFETSEEYKELKALWFKQTKVKSKDPKVILNAARFFSLFEYEVAAKFFQQAQQLEPDNYNLLSELADIYSGEAIYKEGEEKTKLLLLALEHYERALTINKKERSLMRERDRSLLLPKLAQTALDVGKLDKAKTYAAELVLEYGREPDEDSGFNQAAHDGNIILGHVALKEGDIAKAKEQLLIAGGALKLTNTEYALPEMSLAQELLEKNEKDIVIEYLQICAKYSKAYSAEFKKWEQMIKQGKKPKLGFGYK